MVRLTAADGLVLEVSNELPAGRRPDPAGGGRGLAGMRERVELHGGTLRAGRRDGRWVVSVRLPLRGRAAA